MMAAFESSEYTVRRMTTKDMNGALEVWSSFGYSESVETVRIFAECDRNAFYVAVRNDDQKVIGVCASPVTSHSTAFIGMYGVLKDYQRKGIGTKLFNSCLKHIGDRNSGLIAVRDMELEYEKKGFRVKNNNKLVVIKGEPQNIENLYHSIDKNLNLIEFNSNKDLINKIVLYDTKVHNCNREKLITLTVENENHYTLVALNSDGNVLGFGCIKTNFSDQSKMIGPVYADNDSIAEALIISLVKQYRFAKNSNVTLYALNPSTAIRQMCEKLQIKEVDERNLLFTQFSPPINYHLIFFIQSANFSL